MGYHAQIKKGNCCLTPLKCGHIFINSKHFVDISIMMPCKAPLAHGRTENEQKRNFVCVLVFYLNVYTS